MNKPSKPNKPAAKVEIWPIRASIWRQEGTNGAFFNVNIQRVYKNKKKNAWEHSDSFGRDDLLTVAKVADLAHTRIVKLEQEERKAQGGGDGQD